MTKSVIVSIDIPDNNNEPVMIVGRKDPNKPAEILNAVQGQEALDIWKTLIGVRDNE